MSLPLFDQILSQGESNRSVRRSAISVDPARRTDPPAAHEAADANKDSREAQRERVYQYLKGCGAQGATDHEIGVALEILRTSAGKRRGELCKAGLVEMTSMRRPTDTNTLAHVWAVK